MAPHTQYAGARGERRILCVCPRYTTSCGLFEHALSVAGWRARAHAATGAARRCRGLAGVPGRSAWSTRISGRPRAMIVSFAEAKPFIDAALDSERIDLTGLIDTVVDARNSVGMPGSRGGAAVSRPPASARAATPALRVMDKPGVTRRSICSVSVWSRQASICRPARCWSTTSASLPLR